MITSIPRKTPKTLFIRNVFIYDCFDLNTEFEKKVITESTDHIGSVSLLDNVIVYDKIPKTFESLDTWIKKTNLLCWYCGNTFNDIPKFIPTIIEPNPHNKNGNKYIIGVEGNCCRWACCKSLIKEMTHDINAYIEKCNNLNFLYYIWYGKYPDHIPEAPSKFLLQHYGGHLTPDDYYKLYDNLEKRKYNTF